MNRRLFLRVLGLAPVAAAIPAMAAGREVEWTPARSGYVAETFKIVPGDRIAFTTDVSIDGDLVVDGSFQTSALSPNEDFADVIQRSDLPVPSIG